MDKKSLFKSVTFIHDGIDSKAVQALLSGGATQLMSLEEAPRQTFVHIVTEDYNSALSLSAQEVTWASRTAICTPSWIKSSCAKGRIQDVRGFSPDPRQFFSGVQVVCSDLPEGDKEAIYGGVLALGGRYTDDFVKGTTHVVALTMDSEKVREAAARPPGSVEIVLPHWFDDCLRLRRRVPSEPYRLPDPKILQTNLSSGPPSATSPDTDHRYLSSASLLLYDPPVTQEDIFGGKNFYIGNDLQLEGRILETVAAVIGAANGTLAKNLITADIYIGKYREGSQYVAAARSRKIIGNYTWILYCLSKGKYSSPRDHLLHYPIPHGGLPEFRGDIITVSNYTGEARSYLEKLIIALGATFTRNMRPENTHLITAVESGEKYNTAKHWGISCVNHLWLEESYAKWKKMAVTNTHYVTFPRETNLMDVIAQTPIEQEGIELFYNEADTEDEDEQDTAKHASSRTDQDSQAILADLNEESQDVDLPDIAEIRRYSSDLSHSKISATIDAAPRGSVPASTPKKGGTAMQADDEVIPKPSEKRVSKHIAANANLATPTRAVESALSARGSTSRKASQTAASKLRDNMEDANKFAQQQRNKRKLPPLPSESASAHKRAKSTSLPPASDHSIRAVMTGCPELTENLQTQCADLGIELIEDPLDATHVISPRIARTKKFVVAIPHSPYFVNWNWLLDSVRAKKIQPESKYPPEPAPSAPWSKNLKFDKLVSNAHKLREKGGLFKGFVMLVSDAVTRVGGIETYKDIVEANGGICGLLGKRGTDTTEGRIVIIADGKTDPAIINAKPKKKDSKKELKRWEGLEIYDREWLMICAIRQELVFDDKFRYR